MASPIFQKWQSYLRQSKGTFAIDVVTHGIINAKYSQSSPLAIKLHPKAPVNEIVSEIEQHCKALGLNCRFIGDLPGKYTSGSCLSYREVFFNVTGYPDNLSDSNLYPRSGY